MISINRGVILQMMEVISEKKIFTFMKKFGNINFQYGLQWTKYNLQQIIHCVFVDISERVVLLSRHKIDIKEDITL